MNTPLAQSLYRVFIEPRTLRARYRQREYYFNMSCCIILYSSVLMNSFCIGMVCIFPDSSLESGILFFTAITFVTAIALYASRKGYSLIAQTKTIDVSHREKIQQLYRFAEFGRLATGMFHDTMTPLNALIASIDTLEQSKDTDETHHYLKKAVRTSKLMGKYLETIRRQVKPTEYESLFDVRREIRDAITLVKYRARETKTTIHTSMRLRVLLYGNKLGFHNIVVNLLLNALDACEGKKRRKIRITLIRNDTACIMHISDTGCGIPRDLQPKIFDQLFTTKKTGMGVGLSVTKQTVEKGFGGTINVESIESVGTVFIVTIPFSS